MILATTIIIKERKQYLRLLLLISQ